MDEKSRQDMHDVQSLLQQIKERDREIAMLKRRIERLKERIDELGPEADIVLDDSNRAGFILLLKQLWALERERPT